MTRTYNVIDSDGHVLDPPPISGSTTSIRSIATALLNSSSILTARPDTGHGRLDRDALLANVERR